MALKESINDHPDVQRATALKQAGLLCIMGGIGYIDSSSKLHELSVVPNAANFLAQRAAQGLPVYAGPLATHGKDQVLTVYPSSKNRASFGIWIPAEGVDLASIPFEPANPADFTKGINDYKPSVASSFAASTETEIFID